MATTKTLFQHPTHEHPLELMDLRNDTRTLPCRLCHRKISVEAYTCQEGCHFFYHKACVEAPSKIESHPLHPFHPLLILHGRFAFTCDFCYERFDSGGSSFWCDESNFDLDIGCALYTLSDEGNPQGGKTSEQINLPIHPHTLTSFSTRHDFVEDSDCYICQGSVEGDGYMCFRRPCEFIIHKRCIQDLYYTDGTKAPQVYHGHPLGIFVGEDTHSTRCARCQSAESGEFIGCASCQVFYHRHCFQVPEILRYPPHNPDHTLVLFADIGTPRQCESCLISLKNEIYYRCTSCEFFVHIRCAFRVLAYCEEGMSAKIEKSWHKHPLLLCHRTVSASYTCFCCRNVSSGPMYMCEERYCRILLHKKCTEIESPITHPHHQDHPLILCERDDVDDGNSFCKACGLSTDGLQFFCERCLFALHVHCAAQFPTLKHYLHEHKLVRLEKPMYAACNRCGISTMSPTFRCVPCDFNLHEECIELPQVVESTIHWHPLTLYETFLEDDSGEYYCEHCEKTRDPRLGAYVCKQCKISVPRIYHIECALPEIGRVYEKKRLIPGVEKLTKQIADKREEVYAIKEKLKEATHELDELEKQLDIILKKSLINSSLQ